MTGATRRDRGQLGGIKRLQVMREIAVGEMTQTALAAKYGVSQSAVSQFSSRYADEIADIRADMANEFAGILIAQKANRLALYQELAEIALTPTPKLATNGKTVTVLNADGEPETVMEVDVRAAAQVAKQAAEEMGQLPTRLQVQGGLDVTTKYTVTGINPEDLK